MFCEELIARHWELLASWFVLASVGMGAQGKQSLDGAIFAKYSVKPSFHGRYARPDLSEADARVFRTRLRYAAAKGPVFADHYAIAVWGCGTGCDMFAIIDSIDGRVHFAPWSISTDNEAGDRLTFHRNSRAMHIIGALNEQDSADRWFVWDGKALELVSRKPAHMLDDNGDPLPYPN